MKRGSGLISGRQITDTLAFAETSWLNQLVKIHKWTLRKVIVETSIIPIDASFVAMYINKDVHRFSQAGSLPMSNFYRVPADILSSNG